MDLSLTLLTGFLRCFIHVSTIRVSECRSDSFVVLLSPEYVERSDLACTVGLLELFEVLPRQPLELLLVELHRLPSDGHTVERQVDIALDLASGFGHGLCELCRLLDTREAVPFLRTPVTAEGNSLALVDANQVVGDRVRLNGRTHHGTGGIDELRAEFNIQGLLCDLERQFDFVELREGVLGMARLDGLSGRGQGLNCPRHGLTLQLRQRHRTGRMRSMAGGSPDQVQ